MSEKKPPVSPFEDHPEFYEKDNRRFRDWNPVNREMLEKKHRALLPTSILPGKKVLDLGSCMGATGQWCLFYWAASYTGVETQKEYVDASREFLAHHGDKAKIIHSSIPDFFKNNTEKFDIVCLFGVLYVFVDYYRILSAMAEVSNEYVIIENLYPKDVPLESFHLPVVEFISNQRINLANTEASLIGVGTRMTPTGLRFIMSSLGFFAPEGVLEVEKIHGIVDWYESPFHLIDTQKGLRGSHRYLLRFRKAWKKIEELGSMLSTNRSGNIELWNSTGKAKKISSAWTWKFDDAIAKEFEAHAKKHIPDYERVIARCLSIAEKRFSKDTARILDVGSATGFTLRKFFEAGFKNIVWVEASQSMISNSWNEGATIIHSSLFPSEYGPFDMVMANWTLHFIREERFEYLSEIFLGLSSGGCLILSDKMNPSDLTLDLYHDIKRANGVTEEEIRQKNQSIQGVLVPYPLQWYLENLSKIGFTNIEIVNAAPCFVTILAWKP